MAPSIASYFQKLFFLLFLFFLLSIDVPKLLVVISSCCPGDVLLMLPEVGFEPGKRRLHILVRSTLPLSYWVLTRGMIFFLEHHLIDNLNSMFKQ